MTDVRAQAVRRAPAAGVRGAARGRSQRESQTFFVAILVLIATGMAVYDLLLLALAIR
jgi:hypothetical protein